MKFKIYPCLVMLSTLAIFSSCQKDAKLVSAAKTTTTTTTSTATSLSTIAIAAVSTSSKAGKDSIYLVNCLPPHSKRDTVAFSALPAAIGTYLTANYSDYTFAKAFDILDTTKTVTGYIVVIKYNGKPIGLKFTAAGVFVSVLEQQDGANMGPGGPGFHEGGPFCDRDGKKRDSVAISAIPTAVKTYFTTNYPKDTLLQAYLTPDTTYVLISKDTVLYATNITATGALIKRIKVEPHGGMHTAVTQADLLPAITTYLTATYPGYVFQKAYSETNKAGVIGYHVFITVNSTNYVVNFDASGTFLKATVIH